MSESYTEFTKITPAKNLDEVWHNFDPTLIIDPNSEQYVSRINLELQKLTRHLLRLQRPFHAFLCGHRGSGKTTELHRLCMEERIRDKYFPLFLTVREFAVDRAHLSDDAVLVEIARKLAQSGMVAEGFKKEIDDWGLKIVKTFLKNEAAVTEAGAKANAWVAFFRAQLRARREWKTEQKQILEPKVLDLIDILNRMAQDLKNRHKKQLLVVVDDLEKGESVSEKEMYLRLFQESYENLVRPDFSIIYTLPVYFRAKTDKRIPADELFAFSAVRLYAGENRPRKKPPLDRTGEDYQLIRRFVEKRLESLSAIFTGDDVLDELLRIGGGLFRETARHIRDASEYAAIRGAQRIGPEDAQQVFNQVKKEYQPMIRGKAVQILKTVADSGRWVEGVEDYLQSRAVVEYENGDFWIDLRYSLKDYVQSLGDSECVVAGD